MDQNLFDRIIKVFKTFEEFEEFARGKAGWVMDIDAILKHGEMEITDNMIKAGRTLAYVNQHSRKEVTERTYSRKRKKFGLTGKKGK